MCVGCCSLKEQTIKYISVCVCCLLDGESLELLVAVCMYVLRSLTF